VKQGVPLYILGSSGHAREVEAYARAVDPGRAVFFVDDSGVADNCVTVRDYHKRVAIDGGESIMGAGRCEVRREMLHEIVAPLATVIHPSAVILGSVAPGCVVAPGVVVGPNAYLGEHVLVNYNATVGHDTRVGHLSVVGPGSAVGGWCELGAAVYVGAGALIRERLTIQADAIVGMGAVVTKDVPAGVIVVGVPARIVDRKGGVGSWLG
jgi:sugar O-acyltransferase (sialic acid O-acetyltransferase NeuD family)